ncbi:hypothetical protein FHN55_16705 [Streptomyces sp. NP160]|uniref:hypothetical protein n=1 Tax=Streptomyces sp. NP160 TaxID=2586637 RepID=UPI00111ABD21|nr:hypothetical protein [Streptomyces sp. NP160]TNM61949.1 hypothetical protein FHN55_16705 [Streptomyces sp. NP160]
MDGQRRALVSAYWRFCELFSGDRAQRLASDALWWAREAVHDSVEQAPLAEVIDLFDDLLAAPEADLSRFGAGPLEDLLRERPLEERFDVATAVAEQCHRGETADRWREALTSVWITQYDRDLLPALDDHLPPPLDRH